jgi:hypothetical protein
MPVDEHLRLAGETQKVDVYWGRNYDMADMLFAYVPSEKLVIDRRAENLPGALGVARAPGTCSPMSRRRSFSKEAPRAPALRRRIGKRKLLAGVSDPEQVLLN